MPGASPLRRGFRGAVFAGGWLVREAAVGVAEGWHQLKRPPLSRQQQLERDLELARQQGRWISDEEQQMLLERPAPTRLQRALQRARGGVLVLLLIAVLLPPLWPLALWLLAWLLYPRTTLQLSWMAAGLSALLLLALALVLVALLF